MLEPLGLDAQEEAVYRTLVSRRACTAPEVAGLASIPRPAARAAVDSLIAKGFLYRLPGKPVRYSAVQPQEAIGGLALKRIEAIERVRAMGDDLQQEYRRAHHDETADDLIEIIATSAGRDRYLQLLRSATEEIVAIGSDVGDPDEATFEPGIRTRSIYEPAILEDTASVRRLEEYVRRGEQARVLKNLPLRWLLMVDARTVFVPLVPEDFDAGFVVVHARPVVDSIRFLFETLWERAAPIHAIDQTGPTTTDLNDEERNIISLLANGLKDQSVARHLGISPTTVDRRVRRMTAKLGAQTRFQAGVLAARRGWITE